MMRKTLKKLKKQTLKIRKKNSDTELDGTQVERRSTKRWHFRKASDVTDDSTIDGTQIERSSQRRRVSASNADKTQTERRLTRRSIHHRHTEPPEVIQSMRDFCLESATKGVVGLLEEFQEIKKKSRPITDIAKTGFDNNNDKNRYKDVFCIDETRVMLNCPPSTNDYIHANWVDTIGVKHRFICTQAPKPNTVVDFWRMVWQEKVTAIVMLCGIVECGKKKCEQYWPDDVDQETAYEEIVIKNAAHFQPERILKISKLEVRKGEENLNVEHILWLNWPDRGVPENYLASFRLLARIKTISPVIVHCSAGIGRTGTIVGLDMAQRAMQAGEKVNLKDVVMDLRKQRHGSVQTDLQYVYMHRCLMGLSENKRAIRRTEVNKFMDDFDALLKTRAGNTSPTTKESTETEPAA